ncbi:Major facilitator family transporter [Priestia megaterium WSH-002]|uniref:Major facilitator family transporter n=1 Tax=Priestia megaterium (strain WSH-002) TaxID=1006007 RepID=A0A8D3WXK0_PRIMW|nr:MULTISPECIES: MFS transporter [Priestia]AEN88483.1 Major facilitator family transporter [Priestia megaterium WSH-002]MED5245832.1 MFS transporter [Priestia sp. LL-8]
MMNTYNLISESKKQKLIIVLACTLVFSSMSATMFNVALPSITHELSLTPSQAAWIITSYMIIYAIGSVAYGRLADQYKLKNLLTAGLLFFAVGSVIGFFSTNFAFIISARVLQAVGASVFPASAMLIPSRYFPPEVRGKALGITSTGLSLGVAVGPIIAGVITTSLHWHYLFAVSIIPVVAIPFFRTYLDDTKGNAAKLDYLGAALLAGMVTFVLLGISMQHLYYFIISILLLGLFSWRISKAQEPFIKAELFKNKRYSVILLLFACSSGIGFGLPYLTPLLLADVNHLSAFTSSLFMFPGAAITALLAKKGGELADKKGNVVLAYIALSCYFICFISLSIIVGHSPYLIMVAIIFGYIAQSFCQMSLANTVSQVLPSTQTGVGMGLFMLTNFVGSSIATTLMGTSLNDHNGVSGYTNIYIILSIIVVGMGIIYTAVIKKSVSFTQQISK